MKQHVLLACASDWQAPARLPKLFHRAGLEVHLFCAPEAGIAQTRYADHVHAAPPDMASFVRALRAHSAENSAFYVLTVIVDDPLLEALAARADEPWAAALLPVQTKKDVALVTSKAALARRAEGLGIPTPRSRIVTSLADATRAAHEIGWPVVLKIDRSFAGLGVRLAHDREELAAAWNETRPSGETVLQEFVRGALGNTAVLYSRGRVIATTTALKTRTWPGAFGPSCARTFVDRPETAEIVAAFGAATGYDGFAAFDWIVDGDDRLRVLEINARPVPALHLATRAGVDFAAAIADVARERAGGPAARVRAQDASIANAAVFPMFPEDFHRAITDGDEHGLRAFAPGGIGASDVPWDDPPLLRHLLRRRSTRRAFDRILGTIDGHGDASQAAPRVAVGSRSREL